MQQRHYSDDAVTRFCRRRAIGDRLRTCKAEHRPRARRDARSRRVDGRAEEPNVQEDSAAQGELVREGQHPARGALLTLGRSVLSEGEGSFIYNPDEEDDDEDDEYEDDDEEEEDEDDEDGEE